jgi:hypothetical protein
MRAMRVIGFGFLIALVAAGMPLAQSLRVAQTIPAACKKSGKTAEAASVRLLLPGEWQSGSPLAQSNDAQTSSSQTETKLVKPVSDQWDTAFQTLLSVGELPAVQDIAVPAVLRETLSISQKTLLSQTGPPPRCARGPPTIA